MALEIGRLPATSYDSERIIYVIVAGPSGSGKSAFIKEASGPGAAHTPVISTSLYDPAANRNIAAFEVPAGVIKGLPYHLRVVLVEVPGFRMGSPPDDIRIMSDAIEWLESRNAKASGVVYINERNPAAYGTMDAREQLPRLRSWFERLLSPTGIPNKRMNQGINVVVAIIDYIVDYESALREHWAPIVDARRLVLGADHGRWTMESAHSVLRLLDLASCVNGTSPPNSLNLGDVAARAQIRATPEPSGNLFERVFGWRC